MIDKVIGFFLYRQTEKKNVRKVWKPPDLNPGPLGLETSALPHDQDNLTT